MAILHRTHFLALAAVLAASSVACGDDDDNGDNGGTIDAATGGGDPDAAGDGDGDADAGEADAGAVDGGAGGAFDISGTHLLSILIALAPEEPIRVIATVEYTAVGRGATANFSLQPLSREECAPGMGGLPVGDALVVNDVSIAADGTFDVLAEEANLDGDAVPLICRPTTADIQVLGTIQSEDFVCGTAILSALGMDIQGTFGTVRVAPGTEGEDLPDPVVDCDGGGGRRIDAGA